MPTSNGFWASAPALSKPVQQFKATPQMLPPGAPARKTAIDKIVSKTFTATPQGNTILAKQLKAMNLSPNEQAYVQQSSKVKGNAAMKAKSNADLTDLTHTVLPAVANAGLGLVGTDVKHVGYAVQHPVARLENKGPFKVAKGQVSGGMDFPFFGGVEKDIADAVVNPAAEAAAKIQKGLPPTAKTLGETATEALKGTRGLRALQTALRSEEVAKRSKAYAKALQENPTPEGHLAAKAHLAGELPKVYSGGFVDFSPETMAALHKTVADHPDLLPLSKATVLNALEKVKGGALPTPSEEKLILQVFGSQTTKDLKKSVSAFHHIKALGYDMANVPRSVMASYDASGILRQGLLIGMGHPAVFARNIPAYLKAIKSETFYDAGMKGLHNRPNAMNGVYDRMGVDITEMTPKGESAANREEPFRSTFAEKIPGVKASGRGFMLFLDTARADVADLMYAKAVAQGRGEDDHLLQSIGSFVNSASGRGDLTTFAGKTSTGALGRSQEGLNLIFFSPRLIKSRVDFINPFWYKGLDPLARHEAYKAMGGLVVMMATTLTIARSLGAQVNLDPRSSDFAKIKIGSDRIDMAGGFQQYIRILSEIASNQVVSASTGATTNLGQEGPGKTSDWDVAFRFIRSKLAPIVSLGVDVSQRANTVGQPLTWQNTLLPRITPLSGQDAFQVGQDAWQSHGPVAGVGAGIGAGLLSAFGGGVQQYTPRQPKSTGGSSGFWGGGSSGGSSSFWGG